MGVHFNMPLIISSRDETIIVPNDISACVPKANLNDFEMIDRQQ